jgi:hypothetical protein
MGRVSMIGRTAIFSVPGVCGAQADRTSTRLNKARMMRCFMEVMFLSDGWIGGYYDCITSSSPVKIIHIFLC